MKLRGHPQAFVDRPGRSHDVDVAFVFEHSCDALAHDRMVVHNQDSRHYLSRFGVAVFSTGGIVIVTVTVVPRPGVLRIVAWPPTRRARSSMPIRPNPRRRAPRTRKPAPASATVRRRRPRTMSSRSDASRAPACFRTFVRASLAIRNNSDSTSVLRGPGSEMSGRIRTHVSAVNWRERAP